MPRSKRMKKATPASRLTPSSSPSPSRVSVGDDGDADGKTSSNMNLTPPSGGIESIDPALLDEEEVAGEPETITGSTKKSQRDRKEAPVYTTGGGGFNALKSFQGQTYSGMAVGGSHAWNYDQGVWHETKEEPDLWKVNYNTAKRRARKAPKGSGAPAGTEYHWLIVGHQYVKKIDANTYETSLTGSKYKLAHKGSSSGSWSVPTVKGQREREVEILEDAKRRIQGLPPVHTTEKVKAERHEKGQQKLDTLFRKSSGSKDARPSSKKKRKGEGGEESVAADAIDE